MTALVYKFLIGTLVTGTVVGSGVGIWQIVENSKWKTEQHKLEIKGISKIDEVDFNEHQQYVITSIKSTDSVNDNDNFRGGNYCSFSFNKGHNTNDISHNTECKIFELPDNLKSVYETLYSSKNINDEKWTQIDKGLKELTTNKASDWVKTDKLYKFVFTEKINNNKLQNLQKFVYFNTWVSNGNNLRDKKMFEIKTITDKHKLCFRNAKSIDEQKGFCCFDNDNCK